jgi:chemotaxis protein MotB
MGDRYITQVDVESPKHAKKKTGFVRLLPWILLALLIGAGIWFVKARYLPLYTELKHAEEGAWAAGQDAEDCERKLEGFDKEKWKMLEKLENNSARGEVCAKELAALKEEVETKTKVLESMEATANELAKKLHGEIRRGEVLIKKVHGQVVVDVSDKILFDSAEVDLNEQGREVLKRVGDTLRQTSDKWIQVGGHTDAVPISDTLKKFYPTNWELSTARASRVVRFLVHKGNIPGERFVAAGFAQYRPVASNKTREGRRLNRRIEIVLLPKPLEEKTKP